MFVPRRMEAYLDKWLKSSKSLLLLGPRQTGKTTLIDTWIKRTRGHDVIIYRLNDPSVRRRFESSPEILKKEVEFGIEKTNKLVYIDEIQKVPELMDLVQLLIDQYKSKLKFILTGSSARKLRKVGANLLPGRLIQKYLDSFSWNEIDLTGSSESFVFGKNYVLDGRKKLEFDLEDSLIWGSLPEVVLTKRDDRKELLLSYVDLYLEQEIRSEALVRNLGAFDRFLELAALESGSTPNLTNLSNASGAAVTTIKEYFSILNETFVVQRLDAFIGNSRKRILTTPKYYFFDLGVRNACARVPFDEGLVKIDGGRLFEHFVILEVMKRIKLYDLQWKVYYWRTSNGAEVDLIIDKGYRSKLIALEIKFSKNIRLGELTGLKSFIHEFGSKIEKAVVISLVGKPQKLSEDISVIPWQML